MASASDTAQSFGYSLEFFNQDPELKGLLDQATSGGWDANRFVAALRNTSWFQKTGEANRKYTALQSGDPATLGQMLDTQAWHISSLATSMGSLMGIDDARNLASMALRFGWSDDQTKSALASRLTRGQDGLYAGQAGSLQEQINTMASDYGLDFSDDTIGQWVQQGVRGQVDANVIKGQMTALAASKYPPLADRLKSGETVKQIADPYIQSQAKILELNPQSISLKDPLIQQALVSTDDKGQPITKTVYQFEQGLRNDPRWAATQNAQDSMSQTASKILQTFGLTS